tara:strand:+ start:266 stop:1372 length:1107 start_codon:yes stop_codon:yes gene_type:complete
MMQWPAMHSIFISRCFWDYYLHVFQKLHAAEIAANYSSKVTWFDPPTRNPLTWLKERKRVFEGITVRRPFALRNEYERFQSIDRILFNIQLKSSLQGDKKPDLWSIACPHTWLAKSSFFSRTTYWPGDYFRPKEEFSEYEDYDLVMPWTPDGFKNIPTNFKGIPFLSSTCAGMNFMTFDLSKPIMPRFDFSDRFKKTLVYVGGLSTGRIDFMLLEALAKKLPDYAILLGAKSDGHAETQIAVQKLVSLSNVFLFDDLGYGELAELTHAADACLIPYKTSGFNAGCCPNKLFEYSALGKNTVSTPIPALEVFSPLVAIAEHHDSFIKKVQETACIEPSPKRKKDLLALAHHASPEATIQRMKEAFAKRR